MIDLGFTPALQTSLAKRSTPNAGVLLLAQGEQRGEFHLSHYDIKRRQVTILWSRNLPSPRDALLEVTPISSTGRVAFLLRDGSSVWFQTIRIADGQFIGRRVKVDPSASGLAIVDGIPTLVSRKGLTPVRPFHGMSLGDPCRLVGSLPSGEQDVSYCFGMDAFQDLSHGYLAAYRRAGGRLRETYRRDFAPGPFAFVRSGKWLVVLQSGGPLSMYGVSTPERPVFAGSFWLQMDWIALAAGERGARIYALERNGRLRAYRFDGQRGMTPAAAEADGIPVYPAKLFVRSNFIIECGDDGTAQFFQDQGTTIKRLDARPIGKGQVWVVNCEP